MTEQVVEEDASGVSLQYKFILLVIAIVAMAIVPLTLSFSEQLDAAARRSFEAQGLAHLDVLADVVYSGAEGWRGRAERIVPAMGQVEGVAFVSLRTSDLGEALTVFNPQQDQDLLRQEVLPRIASPDFLWEDGGERARLQTSAAPLLVLRRQILEERVGDADAGTTKQKAGEIWLALDLSTFEGDFSNPLERAMVSSLIIAILVVSLAMYLFAREFLGPIRGLQFGAKRLAEGDLDYQITIDSRDELGSLAEAFNSLARTIRLRLEDQRGLVQKVERIVRRLGNSTSAILSVVSQQVSGAGQQASSVHHVSSTAEEIAASSRSVAETAKTMGMAATETVHACEHGKTEVDEAISGIRAARETVTGIASSMERLGADSRKIGEILKLIEGISEQTNLLALNAAIEAAGAGEAGQRFAIVATEVKRLATRTNESTKEIRDLISTIQNSTNKAIMLTEEGTRAVAEGYERVHRVGDSIQEIKDSVERTSLASDAILASSQEQVTATEKMAESMNEIRKVADAILENSSVTEATVEEINEICSQLKALFDQE